MPILNNVNITEILTKFILRNDVSSEWATSTIILEKGEPAIEMDLERKVAKFKIGDGKSTFNELPYSTVTPDEVQEMINNSAIDGGRINSIELVSGTNNGTLKLIINGIETDNIAVTGLGTAAFTDSTAYATATQGEKAENAMAFKGYTDVIPMDACIGDTYALNKPLIIAAAMSYNNSNIEASKGDMIIYMNNDKWSIIPCGGITEIAKSLEKGISAKLSGGAMGETSTEANAGETMNIIVTEINTDYLKQGDNIIIFNGGTATNN